MLFHAEPEPEDRPTATAFVSRSIFHEIDRIDPQVWLIVIVALFVGTLMFCVLGACVLAMISG